MDIYEKKWKNILKKNCTVLKDRIDQIDEEIAELEKSLNEIENMKDSMGYDEWILKYSPVKESLYALTSKKSKYEDTLRRATSDEFDDAIITDFDVRIDGIPVTIQADQPIKIFDTNLGTFPEICYKSQEELDAEYTENNEKIQRMVQEGRMSAEAASELQERMFFTYAIYIKHAPKQQTKQEISEQNSKFIEEVEQAELKLSNLEAKKQKFEKVIDELYEQERNAFNQADVTSSEKYYQRTAIRIKQKEFELSVISLESSISGTKNYIFQKRLGQDKVDGKINSDMYMQQMDSSRLNYSISKLESDVDYTYTEIELNTLKSVLLGIQESRGELTTDSRIKQQEELSREIKTNSEYLNGILQDLLKERKKQDKRNVVSYTTEKAKTTQSKAKEEYEETPELEGHVRKMAA